MREQILRAGPDWLIHNNNNNNNIAAAENQPQVEPNADGDEAAVVPDNEEGGDVIPNDAADDVIDQAAALVENPNLVLNGEAGAAEAEAPDAAGWMNGQGAGGAAGGLDGGGGGGAGVAGVGAGGWDRAADELTWERVCLLFPFLHVLSSHEDEINCRSWGWMVASYSWNM